MKEFTIGKNDAGQRLDRWLAKALPLLPAPLAQKYIRLKRVKVNGKGSKRDVRLKTGDVLQLYINDEFFDKPTPENAFLSLYQPVACCLSRQRSRIRPPNLRPKARTTDTST